MYKEQDRYDQSKHYFFYQRIQKILEEIMQQQNFNYLQFCTNPTSYPEVFLYLFCSVYRKKILLYQLQNEVELRCQIFNDHYEQSLSLLKLAKDTYYPLVSRRKFKILLEARNIMNEVYKEILQKSFKLKVEDVSEFELNEVEVESDKCILTKDIKNIKDKIPFILQRKQEDQKQQQEPEEDYEFPPKQSRIKQELMEEADLDGNQLIDECNTFIQEYEEEEYEQGKQQQYQQEQQQQDQQQFKEQQQDVYEGRLKFFDEIKNYGFIIMDVDNSDIFAHYDDLLKAGVTKDFLRSAKQGNIIRFQFKCMNYIGKYNRSRKAVELKLLSSSFQPYNYSFKI